MQSNHLTVIESWNFSSIGSILVDLQNTINGLAPGTVLQSLETAKRWEVTFRIIYIQADQKRFEHEKTCFEHYRFSTFEALESFIEKIKQNEQKDIRSYHIKPIGHSDKPIIGELLVIV